MQLLHNYDAINQCYLDLKLVLGQSLYYSLSSASIHTYVNFLTERIIITTNHMLGYRGFRCLLFGTSLALIQRRLQAAIGHVPHAEFE